MPPRKAEAGTAEPPAHKRKRAASGPIPAAAGGGAAAGGNASGGAGRAPPPTIVFSTGERAPAPANWASREFAVNAAKFSPLADFVRLAGSCTLSFEVAGKSRADTLARLRAPVEVIPEVVRPGVVRTWIATKKDKVPPPEEGEPSSSGGLAPVGRVLAAMARKKLVACEPHARAFLDALQALVFPDGPWKCPLARAVAHCPSRLADDAPLQLTYHVYLNRLAFELIACEHLAAVMSRLTPVGVVTPVAPLPQYPQTIFTPPEALAADTKEDKFTLPSLLKAMEHGGYREEPQPAGIALPMFSYQRQALAWMRDQEARPGGLNAEFWEKRSWADDTAPWYYFPLAGELRLQEPPVVTGGLLCEQMGLGKTLEMCALIVADKAAATRAAREAERLADATLVPSRATLVVVPTSLLAQWAREIHRSAPDVLSVALYPPDAGADSDDDEAGDDDAPPSVPLGKRSRVPTSGPAAASAAATAVAALANHDVVLTTYRALEAESVGRGAARVLSRIRWRRIALDECQEVRSSTTALAKTAAGLQAAHRWMISGTPLHASVDDLNGELQFLGVWPFSLSDKTDGFWSLKVSQPFQLRQPEALRLLHALLRGVGMRHSKRQCDAAGAPLAALPPSTATLRPVALASSDAYVVKYLEAKAALVAGVSLEAALPPAGDEVAAPWETSSTAARRQAARTADGLLRLLREACTAPAMPCLPAPAGPPATVAAAARVDASTVRGYLREVDRLIRAIGGGPVNADGANNDLLELTAMVPEEALRVLMRRRALQGSAADEAAGLVRMDVSRGTAAYDANRQRAMLSVQERLADASAELAALKPERERAAQLRAEVPRLRWQMAAMAISAGKLLTWHAPMSVWRRTVKRLVLAARVEEASAALDEARAEADAFLARQDVRKNRKAAAEAAGVSVEELREEMAEVADAAGVKASWLRYASNDEAIAELTKAESKEHAKAAKKAEEEAPVGWRVRGSNVEKVAAEIRERVARFARAEEQAAAQAAFMARLRAASAAAPTAAADLDYRIVAQRGFEDVLQIVESGNCPDCTICISKIPAGQAVVTPCVHISCRECMLAWIRTRDVSGPRATVPCPLCRRPFRKGEVIHILPPPPRAAPDADAAGPSRPRAGPSTAAGPSFSLAATDADVDALALEAAPAAAALLPGSGVFPAVPRLFLTHLAAARAALGPKLALLVADLRAALGPTPSAKAVVFSQLPAAVAHVAALLPGEGFQTVRILPAMPEPERRAAVERFNGDPAVCVFVLHVGTAAAGLTLTAANHMFLMEPFLSASDEAQARNRCHRIGQTKAVSTTIYYTRGTVEERLLAYRAHEAAAPVAAAAIAAPEAAEPSAAAEARRRKGKGPALPERRRRDEEEEEEEDDVAKKRKQPRSAVEDDNALATLSADASRKHADDAKMRFLFGLPPRNA